MFVFQIGFNGYIDACRQRNIGTGLNNKGFLLNSVINYMYVYIDYTSIGESFQDYSWIQDFEADFSLKVSLTILNLADNSCFFDFLSAYVRTVHHLNLKLLIFYSYSASFNIWISEVQDFGNFELSPMDKEVSVGGFPNECTQQMFKRDNLSFSKGRWCRFYDASLDKFVI